MKKLIFALSLSGVLLSSCNKFGDTNIDPTVLTSANTGGLLTNSMQAIPTLIQGGAGTSRLANLYVQYLSEGPYPGASLYTDRNLSFSDWYTGPLYNLQTIIEYNETDNPAALNNGAKENQIAAARILKAYLFLYMTDRWGDIPYSEALQGSGDFTPAYDQQQDIYNSLFTELKEAAAQINEAETGVSGDILFGGDMGAWKTFANTIRMIMALHLTKADPSKGQTEYASAVADGVISSNDENVMYTFLSGDPNNYNPWYNNYSVSNRNDYAISTTMTDYMEPKDDPRLDLYAEHLALGIVGLDYGYNVAKNIPSAFSRIGDYFREAGSALPLITYAQVLFMHAEAAKLGWEAGGDAVAQAYYEDAIQASWEYYGVFDQTAFNAYLAEPDVAYSAATGYEQIMTEKWVHMYLNGWETWTDWRRTGYPVLAPATDAIDSRGIPMRLGYLTTESALNADNYAEAVSRLGGTDDNYALIWLFK